MKRILFGLLAGFWIVSPALADDAYTQCIDSTTRNDQWAACGGDWIKREEAKMQTALDTALAAATDNQKAAIDAEQAKWLEFRELSCDFYNHDMGREGQVLSYPACIADLIIERTKRLETYAQGN